MADIFFQVNIVRFLVRTRIWVALAAAALSADVWLANNSGVPIISLGHVFFMTLAGYLFIDNTCSPFRKPLMYIALTGVVLGLLIDPLFNLWPLALAAAFLGLYQTSWIVEFGIKLKFELRKIIGIKNAVIALCWTLISSAAYIQLPSQQPLSLWWWLGANFLFVFVLSIAEDLVDIQHDNTTTLAISIGKSKSAIVCFLLLLCSCLFAMSAEADSFSTFVHLLLCFLSLILVLFLLKSRARDVASLLIDGLIILKGLLPFVYYVVA